MNISRGKIVEHISVKMNDTEFDDWSAYGSMKDNAAELDTQVAIADGLFLAGIFWMTSAFYAATISRGQEILQRVDC